MTTDSTHAIRTARNAINDAIARRDPDLFVLWRQGVRPEVGV